MSKKSDSSKNTRLGIVAAAILVLAAGIFMWQRSTTLKPGTVIMQGDADAVAATDPASASSGEEIEVEELEGVDGNRPVSRGGARVVEGDD